MILCGLTMTEFAMKIPSFNISSAGQIQQLETGSAEKGLLSAMNVRRMPLKLVDEFGTDQENENTRAQHRPTIIQPRGGCEKIYESVGSS